MAKEKRISIGMLVRINLDREQEHSPIWKFNGQEAVVKSEHKTKMGYYYKLYGVQSEYGKSYVFCPEWLEKVGEA